MEAIADILCVSAGAILGPLLFCIVRLRRIMQWEQYGDMYELPHKEHRKKFHVKQKANSNKAERR